MDTRKIKIVTLFFNFILSLGIATITTSALAVVPTTPYLHDANTILLDHFDGTTSASILAYSETGAACGSAKPSVTPDSAYVTGLSGLSQALSLNPPTGQPAGSATYLQYPGGQLMSLPNGTIEFWVYLSSYGTGVSLVDQGQFYGACMGWTFGMSVSATGQLNAGAWAAFTMNSGATVVPLNTWTHIATSWGSAGAKLYINGVQVGSDANTGMPASGYGGSVLVNSGAVGRQIDELRISNIQQSDFQRSSSWLTKAPIPVARYGAAARSVNGVLYVAGGADAAGPDSALRAYNPTTDSWSTLAPMPGGRYSGNGATVINGQLYIAGGWTWMPPLPNNNLWVYDPPTDTWSARASMPTLSACGSSAAINDKLYVTTGCNGYSGWQNFLHVYDPATNVWNTLPSSPDAHASGVGAAINGKFYVVGGVGSTGVTSARLDVYDPATNAWSTLAPMPTARQNAAAVVVNGTLYVIGGYSAANTYLSTVEVYDPITNTWVMETPMLTARQSATSDIVNGVIYVIGGSDATRTLAVNEALSPIGNMISQTISFGSAPSIVIGGSGGTLSATATSGLPVVFSSLTTSVCTISGSTVTGVAAGTCTIAADQAGDATYSAATQVSQNIAIGTVSQTISFGIAPAIAMGGTGTVTATATSGLPVVFSSLTTSVCTISGSTVMGVAAGTCTIAADQAGDATYSLASQVTQNINIIVSQGAINVTGVVRLRPQVLMAGFDPILIDLVDTSFKLFCVARPGNLPIQFVQTSNNNGSFSMAMTYAGTYSDGDQRYETTYTFPRGAFPNNSVLGDLFGSATSQFGMSVVDIAQQTHSFPHLEFGNNVPMITPVTSPGVPVSTTAGTRRSLPQVLAAGLDPMLVDLGDTSFDIVAIVRAGVVPVGSVSVSQNQGGFFMAMNLMATLPNGDEKYKITYTYPRGAFPETRMADLFGTQPGQFNIIVTDQAQQTHRFPELRVGNHPAM